MSKKRKKFYAVKRGLVTGILTSWEECEASVKGFSNARFKGFNARGDAEEWLSEREDLIDVTEELDRDFDRAVTNDRWEP